MKGKYAARADRRQEFTGLEQRAVTAERERDRLATELAELRDRSEERLAGMRRGMTDLRKQRDAAASPRLAQLEQINNRLRAERSNALDQNKFFIQNEVALADRLSDYLIRRFGLSGPEAKEAVNALWDAPVTGERWVSRTGVAGRDVRVIEAVQRARRQRGQQNVAAEIAPDAVVTVNTGFRAARVAEINERLTESLMPIYSYDQAEVSLVLSGDLDGALRVYIEDAAGLAEILIPSEERPRLTQAIQQQEEVTEA